MMPAQDQWNRKKQTKAEAKAARMNKFDPDSDLNRSAKEIMDERAKNKRKLRELQEAEREEDDDEADEEVPGIVMEEPGEGLKRRDEQPNKKQRRERPDEPLDNLASVVDENPAEMTQEELMKAAKRDAQRAERKAKKEKKADKRAAKAAAKEAAAAAKAETAAKSEKSEQTPSQKKAPKAAEAVKQPAKGMAKDTKTPSNDHDRDEEYETVSGESDAENEEAVAAAPRPVDSEVADSTASSPRSASHSPVFDSADASNNAAANHEVASTTTTTSTSSTDPPSEKPKQLNPPRDTSAFKARLAARIAELQAARKAIGPDGKPIRTRQELIEAQRARQAQRKAKKTELRRQTKLEEERQRDEALASNSPSIMSPALDHLLADDDNAPTDYSFGRVAFNDHTRLSRDLTHALNTHKKKGPSDPKTALLKLQNQKKKHAALDAEKQADVEEKEAWLTARRRAEGDRIHDDEATLKKAVKRKDKQKKRSEKDWKERAEGVTRAVEGKQRKREENLKKRKDEKKLGKAGKKLKVKVAKKKKGGRPGFEGSFGMGGNKSKK